MSVFVALSNIQPMKVIFVIFLEPFCTTLDYATPTGGFRDDEIPMMHRTYEDITRWFNLYKQEHSTDTVLYRLYRINPALFWEWSAMISEPKYRLPYLNPREIPPQKRQ